MEMVGKPIILVDDDTTVYTIRTAHATPNYH